VSPPGRPKGSHPSAEHEGARVTTITSPTVERVKVALGLLLGLGIGALCRFLAIPSPAPPVLPGALLVVAMTLGYIAADRWLCRRQALHAHLCGGPDGRTQSAARRVDPPA
jgi:XapX domain-containing protein